jgi:hypothetical protein
MTKREIYYIIFNKHIGGDGKFEADHYQLEEESVFQQKIPKNITIREKKVTVVFTDESRHIFTLDDSVEFFDRLIEAKDADKNTDNTK